MPDSRWVSGRFANCLYFDGIDDRIDCGNTTPISSLGDGSFSISFWMKSGTSIKSYGAVFSKLEDGNSYIAISSYGVANSLYVIIRSNSSQDVQAGFTGITPFDGTWHNVVVVVNLTENTIEAYQDGIKSTTVKSITNLASVENISNSGNLSWGGSNDGTAPYMGNLDECMIFNKALSQIEVTHLYNSFSYESTTSTITIDKEYNFTSLSTDYMLKYYDTNGDSVTASIDVTATGESQVLELQSWI
jgi:hypothetical protein